MGGMTLPDRDVAVSWVGLPVEEQHGGRVGSCTALYLDDATDLPEWMLVKSEGDAGPRFLPLLGAHQEGGAVHVPFSAELIETAPRVGSQGHLSESEEEELYRHYGVPVSTGASDTVLPAAVTDDLVESAAARDTEPDAVTATMPPLQPEPLPTPEPLVPGPPPEPLVPSPPPEPLQPSPAPPTPEPLQPSPPPEPLQAPQPSPPPPTLEPPPSPPRRTPEPLPSPGPIERPAPKQQAPAPPRPTSPVSHAKRRQPLGLRSAGIAAGVVGTSTAAVLLRRERRRTATEPVKAAGRAGGRGGGLRSAGHALAGAAGVVTGVAEALGSELSRAGVKLGETTAEVVDSGARALIGAAESGTRAVTGAAETGTRAVTGAAESGTRAVTGAAKGGVRLVADAVEIGARSVTGAAEGRTRAVTDAAGSGTRAVTDAAGSARDAAVASRRRVRRSWRRTATRATAALSLGAGYVLGARAGERRYVQIRSAVERLSDRLGGADGAQH